MHFVLYVKLLIRLYAQTADIKLYIRIKISNNNNVILEIKYRHTKITKIEKNGKILLNQVCNNKNFNF